MTLLYHFYSFNFYITKKFIARDRENEKACECKICLCIDCSCTNTKNSNSKRFPEPIKLILREWFLKNPYPAKCEINYIMLKTGLSNTQVNHWFKHERSRSVRKLRL